MFQQLHGHPQDVKGRKKRNSQLQISVRGKVTIQTLILQNATTPKRDLSLNPLLMSEIVILVSMYS